MYTPASFAVSDLNKLHDHMERHSFATVVSIDELEPIATHLPLLLDRGHEPYGQLVGHMAKANSQWETAADRTVLVIFRGPHAYISPTWYDDQNVVPTWNYSAVHAYGTLRLEEDPSTSAKIVRQYVKRYEAEMPTAWSLDSVNEGFAEQLLSSIMSFTINIDRLEGKWKLSQNHSQERRQKVINGLKARNWPGDQDVSDLMSENV